MKNGFKEIEDMTFTERKIKIVNFFLRFLKGKHSRNLNYEQIYLNRGDGTRLRVCVYSPLVKKENVPGLLWIHGGGYAFGIPEQDDLYIKRFVEKSGCVVVSPDYRLSVKAPYPAAMMDCYRTLLWLKKNGKTYGMREDQIMTGGTSAGGGLALAVALYARDRKKVSIAFQMPIYPMIDDRMITPSSIDNKDPLWNSESNKIAWKLYLGELFGMQGIPYYAAPGRAEKLWGMPPTLSFVGSLDPFKDETVSLIKNLKDAEIPTHFKLYNNCSHGFDVVRPYKKESKSATRFLMKSFDYATKNYFSKQPD